MSSSLPDALAALILVGGACAHFDVAAQGNPVALTFETQVEKNGRLREGESIEMTIVADGGDRIALIMDTDDETLHTIFDAADNTMTTVTADGDDGLQAMIVPIPKIRQRDLEEYAGQVERTDQTKEILGYAATKFIVDDDGQITEAWVASIPGLTYEELFGKLRASDGGRTIPRLPDMPDAITLESHTTSRNGRKVYHSYARELARGGEVDLSVLEVPTEAEVMDMTSLRGVLGG